jgi:hypothetical protein
MSYATLRSPPDRRAIRLAHEQVVACGPRRTPLRLCPRCYWSTFGASFQVRRGRSHRSHSEQDAQHISHLPESVRRCAEVEDEVGAEAEPAGKFTLRQLSVVGEKAELGLAEATGS